MGAQGGPWGTRGCSDAVIIYVYEMGDETRGGNKMDGKWSKVIKVFIPGCYPRSNARSKPREPPWIPYRYRSENLLPRFCTSYDPAKRENKPCITVTYIQLRRSSSRLFLAREIFLSSAIYFTAIYFRYLFPRFRERVVERRPRNCAKEDIAVRYSSAIR